MSERLRIFRGPDRGDGRCDLSADAEEWRAVLARLPREGGVPARELQRRVGERSGWLTLTLPREQARAILHAAGLDA